MSTGKQIKFWKPVTFDCCDECGGTALVLSSSLEVDTVFDGEAARCEECGLIGFVSYDEEGLYINWIGTYEDLENELPNH